MIEVQGLVKKFSSVLAVDDISFTVAKGEIVGFLGPNGAGKTTTLNIMTGFLSSTTGSVKIDEVDILENPIEAKKKIGFLPEQPPLYVEMTVHEYLRFIYELKGCKLKCEDHLREICNVVQLSDVYDRLINNLSKGYRQRVGIAQALVGNPKVLIFDEPTVGLDPKQIIEIRNLIKNLGRSHTIILSTHILPEVQAVCDRILIIHQGKIVANEKTENILSAVDGPRRILAKICGPGQDVLRRVRSLDDVLYAEILGKQDADSTSFLIESRPKIDIRKPLFFEMSEQGWPIIGLEGMGMNLEDIFIQLTTDKKEKRTPLRRTRQTNTLGTGRQAPPPPADAPKA